MQTPFYSAPSTLPKTVEVVHANDEGFELGTLLEVRHAMSSVLCVVHPITQKNCYIRRAEVRSVSQS